MRMGGILRWGSVFACPSLLCDGSLVAAAADAELVDGCLADGLQWMFGRISMSSGEDWDDEAPPICASGRAVVRWSSSIL